jgi:hypothetical protein
VALLAVSVAEMANLGGIIPTDYTAPARLRGISSLTALVGQSRLPPIRQVAGATPADVQVVVIGDSTAAGLGLSGLAHPGKLDRAWIGHQREPFTQVRDLPVKVVIERLGANGRNEVSHPPCHGSGHRLTPGHRRPGPEIYAGQRVPSAPPVVPLQGHASAKNWHLVT